MKLVLGQITEKNGNYTMRRAVELPAEKLKELPAKQAKGILYGAFLQLMEVEREAEVAELNKMLIP